MLTESFGRYEPDAATFNTKITSASAFLVEYIADDLIAVTINDDDGNRYETIAYISQREEMP